MNDIFVYKVPLPTGANGVTVSKDGDYLVFVNSNLCQSKIDEAIKHELKHIELGHLYDEIKYVCRCEREI